MVRAAVLALLLVGGCKDKEEETAAPTGELSGCDPTDPGLCALPWPSGYFQVDDASQGSGKRNNFGPAALPGNRDNYPYDPTLLNERDGFSTLTPLVVFFDGVALDGVVGHADLGAYTAADVKTVILDATTGERIPHFVELDMTADEHQRSLLIRPVAPMKHGTRHVVGIRGLVRKDGGAVAPSPGFQALRDSAESDLPDIALMQGRYDKDIFPVLADAGFERGELQLAWDFTTVSRENLHRDVLFMRDDALARLPASGPSYTIEDIELGDCGAGEEIHTTIEGTVAVARYMDIDLPGGVISREPDGTPAYQAETHPKFLIRIPCSLALDPEPAPMLLQYGHGLLGDRGEARTSWLRKLQQEQKWVVFAMDWNGMATRDVPGITLMMAQDVSGFRMIPERSQQGLVEFVVGMRMMQTSIVDDPALTFGGVKLLEGAPVGYFGNSQGGILGAGYMALSPDIERGVLGVPGMPYSMLLSRSVDFDPFFKIFREKYLDHREITLLLTVIQTLWDPGEPSGYADVLTREPFPGNNPKQVLLHPAIGDSQVTPLGAHIMARAFDAKTVAPQTRPIWGIEEAQPGFSGSAIVEWEYTDVPVVPDVNLPPEEGHDTHECPRREPAAQAQIVDFLVTGAVNQHCVGQCIGLREGLCD